MYDRHILLIYEKCNFQELLPFVKIGQNTSFGTLILIIVSLYFHLISFFFQTRSHECQRRYQGVSEHALPLSEPDCASHGHQQSYISQFLLHGYVMRRSTQAVLYRWYLAKRKELEALGMKGSIQSRFTH